MYSFLDYIIDITFYESTNVCFGPFFAKLCFIVSKKSTIAYKM